jgi:hypothetical protein
MTTNQPVELGKVSEETKHVGLGTSDNPSIPFAQEHT